MIDKRFKITLGITASLTLLFSALSFRYGAVPGALCLFCSAAVAAVYIAFTKRRFEKISELNEYLAAVSAGDVGRLKTLLKDGNDRKIGIDKKGDK